jgi:hypothetical protein
MLSPSLLAGKAGVEKLREARHPGRGSLPQEVYFFDGEAVGSVYEVGELAFEVRGLGPSAQ